MTEHWPNLRRAVIGGNELAYRILGPPSGLPTVLLHGLASSSETWCALAVELASSGRQVVVPDLRGHGASVHEGPYALADFRADVEELLEYLEIGRADLVGHSLGGRVASMLAAHRPDRVRRLVLEEVRPPRRPGTVRTRNRRPTPIDLARNLNLLPRLLSFDLSMTGPLLRQFRAPDPNWWSALPAITAKTLLVCGGNSGYAHLDGLREMMILIPDCSLTTIEAGHRVHSTRAREFHATVLPFLLD